MIRRLAWGLFWRVRGVVRLYRHANAAERWALTRYAVAEALAHLPLRGRRRAPLAWIRLGGYDVQLALGRYELGGYLDVWVQRVYEQAPDCIARRGWYVVDVGANVGFFALRQVRLGADVFALEPNPAAHARLAATVARNGLGERIALRQVAAGRAAGQAALSVGSATVTGTLLPADQAGARDRFVVPVAPLDALLPDARPIDLMKIDTEGSEVAVLAGATDALRRTERVILEWHSPALRADAGALLAAAGLERSHSAGSVDAYRRVARTNAARQPSA